MAFPTTPVLDPFNRVENPLSQGGNWGPMYGGVENPQLGYLVPQLKCTATGAQGSSSRENGSLYHPQVSAPIELWVVGSIANPSYADLCWITAASANSATINGYCISWSPGTVYSYIYLSRIDNGEPITLWEGEPTGSVSGVGFSRSATGAFVVYALEGSTWTQIATVTDNTYTGPGNFALRASGTNNNFTSFGGTLSAVPVARVAETETAQSVRRSRIVPVYAVSESDSTLGINQVAGFTKAAETETAQTVTPHKFKHTVNTSTETDNANDVFPVLWTQEEAIAAEGLSNSFGDRLYDQLYPFANIDDNGHLRLLCDAINVMFQQVEDLTRVRPDNVAGYGNLLDIDWIPAEWLGYLGQFVGVRLNPALNAAEQREWVRSTDGFNRGRPASIKAAAQRTLIGDRVVLIRERYQGASTHSDDWPWTFLVMTRLSETPNPSATLSTLMAQKPAPDLMIYIAMEGITYQYLKDTFNTYQDVKNFYSTYDDVFTAQIEDDS